MFRSLLFRLSLLLFFAPCALSLDAHFASGTVIINDGPKRIRVPNVVEDHAEHSIIHSICRKDGDYYLVVGASVWSRGWPPRGGHCGCGIESYVEWIHFSHGKILERQRGLYESCFEDREGTVEWKNKKLIWKATQSQGFLEGNELMDQETEFSWSYDPAHPDDGIEETSNKLEPKRMGVTYPKPKE